MHEIVEKCHYVRNIWNTGTFNGRSLAIQFQFLCCYFCSIVISQSFFYHNDMKYHIFLYWKSVFYTIFNILISDCFDKGFYVNICKNWFLKSSIYSIQRHEYFELLSSHSLKGLLENFEKFCDDKRLWLIKTVKILCHWMGVKNGEFGVT